MKYKYIKYVYILLVICVIVTTIILYKDHLYLETFIQKPAIPNVKFPFKNIRDEHNKNTNVIAIVAPFRNKDNLSQYHTLLNKGYKFIGITSYLQFPGKILNKYDPASKENMEFYLKKCVAWMYCFHHPRRIFTDTSRPIIEMAQSDFTDPAKIIPKNRPIIYDFIYVCLRDNKQCKEGWNAINRNWLLAKKCIKIMCLKYKLKGLIIGRSECSINKNNLTFCDQLKYSEFIKTLEQCRFVFLPNIMDASPRILTEALCLNKPILVNKKILGGWKYVNNMTGEFFTNTTDLPNALDKLIDNLPRYRPRTYFQQHYGPKICGPKLAKFIKKYYHNFTPCKSAEPFCCD